MVSEPSVSCLSFIIYHLFGFICLTLRLSGVMLIVNFFVFCKHCLFIYLVFLCLVFLLCCVAVYQVYTFDGGVSFS